MWATISPTLLDAPPICSPASRAFSPASSDDFAAKRAFSEIPSIATAISRVIEEVLLTMSAVPSAPRAMFDTVDEIS